MHDRSRRLTDDPVLCINDIEDFFGHVPFRRLIVTWIVATPTAPRHCQTRNNEGHCG
jgi:hypothetical protein